MRLAARAEGAARTAALALLASASLLLGGPRGAAAQNQNGADPLPSWNDGAAKRAIIDFVGRVTRSQSADFVPVAERIATFANDGTLWQEKPVAEGVFALGRLRELASRDPSLRQRQPFKAALEGDVAYLRDAGVAAVLELLKVAYAGVTQERFTGEARAFLDTARHPTLARRYTELAYPPMLELLAYLRAYGFRTWLCSGGTTDFMRIFSQDVYGIPAEQVIGSELKRETRFEGPRMVIWRLPEIETLDDEHMKPVNIDRHIGVRPLLAAGNVRSGGDVAQLQYSRGRAGPSLQLLINHDDATREFAYMERDSASLKAARTYGFVVVSMRRDWKTVFAPPGTVARQRRVP
jgi:phosphoserine phosphatase